MYKPVEYYCNPQFFPQPDDILCSNQFVVEERIELPSHKPIIDKILESKVTAEIESYKLIDTPRGKKVFVRGILEQKILYVVDSLCQPVHAFHSTFPFCEFMKLCECGSSFDILEVVKPKIIVEYMETIQLCPRSIRKCVLLFMWYPKGIITPPCPPRPYLPRRTPSHAFLVPPKVQIIQECHVECKPKTVRYKKHKKYRYDE